MKLPSGELAATFDLSTMTGTLSTDGSAGTRRFQIRAAPYNGTYSLVFVGYGAGDRKPATESMTPKSSVVTVFDDTVRPTGAGTTADTGTLSVNGIVVDDVPGIVSTPEIWSVSL